MAVKNAVDFSFAVIGDGVSQAFIVNLRSIPLSILIPGFTGVFLQNIDLTKVSDVQSLSSPSAVVAGNSFDASSGDLSVSVNAALAIGVMYLFQGILVF